MTTNRRSVVGAWLLTLLLGVATLAVAQEAPQETPAVTEATPEAGQVMIRFLNAAPNAEVAGVALSDGENHALVEQFAGVGYGELSDYVAVPEGGYEVIIDLASVAGEEAGAVEVPADGLDTYSGEYYTIALIGLVQPEEGSEGGFVEWLQGLFTDQDDAFTLRAMTINDMAPFVVGEGEAEIRLAHLAPGSEAVELVHVDEEGADSIHSIGYGDVSGFGQFALDGGRLELRVAGSEAVVLDLANLQLESGSSQTLFLIGTPVEEVPLQPIVARNPAASTMAAAPGSPAASTDMTFYREALIEIEARLAEIQSHLEQMSAVEGAQEDAAAALARVEEAFAFLEEAHDQLSAQPAAVPAVPAEQPAGEDQEGDGN